MTRSTPAHAYSTYVAVNIRRLRVLRAFTQARLAELADLDVRYVQRIEGARVNVTIDVLVRIADALGVTPIELLAEDPTR